MTNKLSVLSSLFLITLCSCSLSGQSLNNESNHRFEDYQIVNDNQINWQDVLMQEESNYFVFVYSETCSNCHDIQEEIVNFAVDKIMPTYFVDTKKSGDVTISKDVDSSIGASKMDDVSILGTPSVLEVEDKIVIANIAGKENILSLLNEKRANKDN